MVAEPEGELKSPEDFGFGAGHCTNKTLGSIVRKLMLGRDFCVNVYQQ